MKIEIEDAWLNPKTEGWLKGMVDVRGWIKGWRDNQRYGTDRHLWDTEHILKNLIESIDRDVTRVREKNASS